MKLMRKLTAFLIVFALLASSVAVMSAAVDTGAVVTASAEPTVATESVKAAEPPTEAPTQAKDAPASTAAPAYTPRLTAPAYSNQYYYSNKNVFYKYGYGMPNCTCYAWGRAYEILGKEPNLCVYSAYVWYDYNLEYGYYPCGTEPKVGAIACWVYSSGTSGHVAVVEKVEKDKITFSNSAYGGTEFYLTTSPVNDPSDGRESWIFQGYIYIGDFEGSAPSQEPTEAPTESKWDVYKITSDTGVNLRSGAGTSFPVIGSLRYDQQVEVTETVKAGGYTWGKTKASGKTGWFVTDFAKLVRKGTSSAVTPTEAPTQKPTQASTEKPTQAPTVKPTTPAAKPTTAPTQPATQAPTQPATQRPQFEYAPRPDQNVIMGDLDSDGVVSIMDATRIQRIIAEMFVPTKYMLIVGDYDGDSCFSIMDATRIRYDLVKKQ